MPRSGQIIPKYSFPHSETYVNDYTIRRDEAENAITSSSEVTYSMHVFPSPSGRDREMTTITGGLSQFISLFGKGNGKTYGQSYMNAYAAASSGAAILQCLRVTPDDATYANAIVWVGAREDNGVDTWKKTIFVFDSGLVVGNLVNIGGEYTDGKYLGQVTKYTDIKDAAAGDVFVVAENANITIGSTQCNAGDMIKAVQRFEWTSPEITEQSNPKAEGWFELVDGTYVVSNDEEVNPEKTYAIAFKPSDVTIVATGSYTIKTYTEQSISQASPKGLDLMYLTTYIRSDDTTEVEITEEDINDKPDIYEGYKGKYVIGEIIREWKDFNDFGKLYAILYKADQDLIAGGEKPKYIPNGFEDTETETESGFVDEVGAKFTYVKIFAVIAANGRGTYGRNYSVQIQNAYTEDKRNDYKNHNLSVIDLKTMQIIETYPVSFYENAASGGSSIFVDDVINDAENGSDFVQIAINSDIYDNLFDLWSLAYTKYYYESVVPNGTADVSELLSIAEFTGAVGTVYTTIAKALDDIPVEMKFPINIGEFDPITGLLKGARSSELPGLSIVEPIEITTPVPNYVATSFTGTLGVSLYDGADGTFVEVDTNITKGSNIIRYNAAGSPVSAEGVIKDLATATDWENSVSQYGYATDTNKYLTAIELKILQGFLGDIDKSIKSKKRFPTTYILDAGYPAPIKQAIWSLKEFRTDCVAYFDAGDPSKEFVNETFGSIEADLLEATGYKGEYESLADVFAEYTSYFLPLKMKVKDAVSKKPTWVTYTYILANMLPSHFLANYGKHVPFAGSVLGKLSGFIKGTVSPVYEDDIDFEELDQFAEYHVNYAKYNADGTISIAMQDTHQDIVSDLSEMNAVLIMLDVKRDCERLIEQLEYQFNEVSDVIRFNSMLEMNVLPYYSAAQVRSIRGEFSRNQWESERGILHLYIEIANKDLVKTGIIEIDIVQGDSQA